ncbi:MAG: PEP-CTERM sorting domain-containing protein [Candidatus Omnitrophica bacterium]|nr:PEP-CTERM sorting domain-containing protein [Candidatus Omnitrophota bacterium]
MKKVILFSMVLSASCLTSPAKAAISVDVYRDGYIEDFTRSQVVPPDGIADRISDTNALLASRGEFFDQFNAFNVDSHAIMTFDVSFYSGQNLLSAFLTGYGTRVDNRGSLDPISGEFYLYSGDGLVGLDDFNVPGDFLGSRSFQMNSAGFNLDPFQVDVTSSLQDLLDSSSSFAEFRVESESASVFINAGETDPSTFFSVDTRWPGPRLVLEFDQSATAVPEPATILMLGGGLLGGFFRKRKQALVK